MISVSMGFGTEAALRRIGLLTRGLGGGGTVPVPFPLPLPRRELVPLGGPRYFPRPFPLPLPIPLPFPFRRGAFP